MQPTPVNLIGSAAFIAAFGLRKSGAGAYGGQALGKKSSAMNRRKAFLQNLVLYL